MTEAEPLTPRELDVLRLLARGLGYADVAQLLAVSVNTVRTHIRSLYSKLGVVSKTRAVVVGMQSGLIDSSAR